VVNTDEILSAYQLKVIRSAISNPNGLRPFVAVQVRQFDFFKLFTPMDGVPNGNPKQPNGQSAVNEKSG
jgi:hypothetical protein